MGRKKTAYELSRSQVSTPHDVVSLFWEITHTYRPQLSRVFDLGAGDGRFALGGRYETYEGIEIDPGQKPSDKLPSNAVIRYGCAFKHAGTGFDACIGNPPYVRHHDLEHSWRDRIAARIAKETGVSLNRKCNLFVYFIFLALLKSAEGGIVSTVVPYEWVSRPSAEPLRRFIKQNGWHVDTYKFTESIFDNVLTTASISVIDKACDDGEWSFFKLRRDGNISPSLHATGSRYHVLTYENRGALWAKRGMSPGTQKIFTLTEGERVHAGLSRKDVLPCVTSLREVPRNVTRLSKAVFRKHFIDAGAKCWLIKSYSGRFSSRLHVYLDSVPERSRGTSTCMSQNPWYKYPLFNAPRLLVSTGFTKFGPKVLLNSIEAHAVGSVCGVYTDQRRSLTRVRDFLVKTNFEAQVVPHAKLLKKIEIRQLNAVLNEFIRAECGDG